MKTPYTTTGATLIACAVAAIAPYQAWAQRGGAKARATARAQPRVSNTRVSNTRVVPGVSIGRVALGDTQAEVRLKLGAPVTSFKLNQGLTSDLWRAAVARRWDKAPHTFEVVYRRGVAIQIEATNTAFTTSRGLGLKSSDRAWERVYGKRDESKQYSYVGGKRDQGYDDWISAGFALEYQWLPGHEGASNAEEGAPVQMHTLIVHYKGVPVIPDPGGS